MFGELTQLNAVNGDAEQCVERANLQQLTHHIPQASDRNTQWTTHWHCVLTWEDIAQRKRLLGTESHKNGPFSVQVDWTEQSSTSHSTHFRSFRRRRSNWTVFFRPHRIGLGLWLGSSSPRDSISIATLCNQFRGLHTPLFPVAWAGPATIPSYIDW